MNFVKQIFVMQAEAGRHAHVEQPAYAKSWKTRALRDLPGYFVYFDQCMLGLNIPGEGPARKRTAFGLRSVLLSMPCYHTSVTAPTSTRP